MPNVPEVRKEMEAEVLIESDKLVNVGLNREARLRSGSPFFVYCQKVVDMARKMIESAGNGTGTANINHCSEAVQIAFDCFHEFRRHID